MNTAEMVQDAGYVVIEAGSAEEATAALQTMAIDILITDVNLPGATGAELAQRARAISPSIRVIYATGDASSVRGDRDAVILGKPYDEKQLLGVLAATTAPASTTKPTSVSDDVTDEEDARET